MDKAKVARYLSLSPEERARAVERFFDVFRYDGDPATLERVENRRRFLEAFRDDGNPDELRLAYALHRGRCADAAK